MLNILADALLIAMGQTPPKRIENRHVSPTPRQADAVKQRWQHQ